MMVDDRDKNEALRVLGTLPTYPSEYSSLLVCARSAWSAFLDNVFLPPSFLVSFSSIRVLSSADAGEEPIKRTERRTS